MNLRTSLLALGLSLTAASAFAATPTTPAATAKPAAAAKADKHDKQDCTKRSKAGHCEQWAAKPAGNTPAPAKH